MQPHSYTIGGYIATKQSLYDKVLAIEVLIDAMILSTADAIGGMGSGVAEYQLDDGQVKVKTAYRSTSEVTKGITELEKIKQMYMNRLNGSAVRLMDDKTFRR